MARCPERALSAHDDPRDPCLSTEARTCVETPVGGTPHDRSEPRRRDRVARSGESGCRGRAPRVWPDARHLRLFDAEIAEKLRP
jgi:hypothetical protein